MYCGRSWTRSTLARQPVANTGTLRPQLTAAAGYGIVAWSFLIDILAALIKGADWLRDSSLFTHIAIAPAVKPDWGADLVIVGLGVAAAAIGAIVFQRRDVLYA
jgi:putative exporter of polyketide antibiotics